MPQQNIYFLNFEGPAITDGFTEVLFKTAQEMFIQKSEQKVLKNDIYEAIITTKWTMVGLGVIFGYEFTVKVEFGNKTSNIKFLSRKADLENNAFAISTIPSNTIPMVTYPSAN